MINEPGLRDALVALADSAKTQYIAFCAVLDEVVALRETVKGLDPTFSDVMTTKRDKQASLFALTRKEAIDGYDEIIRRLKAGEVV
jgi:hypothetical protein